MMNLNQKIVLCLTLVGVALIILFPPFTVKMLGAVAQNGHHFITDPPNPMAKVDIASVVIRCVVLAVAGGVGFIALADKKQ